MCPWTGRYEDTFFYLKQTKSVKSAESVFNNKWKNLYSIINEYGLF